MMDRPNLKPVYCLIPSADLTATGEKLLSLSMNRVRHQLTGRCLGLSLLALSATANATTIVVLTTNDRIVLAADSRQLIVEVSNGRVVRQDVVDTCKIRIGPGAAVAAWDVASEKLNNGGGYDTLESARPFLGGSDTIPEKLDNFFHAFMKANSVKLGAGESRPEQPVGVVFLGWDRGAPARAWAVLSRPEYRTDPFRLSLSDLVGKTLDFHLTDLRVCTGSRCPGVRVFGREDGIDVDAIDLLLRKRPNEAAMVALARSAVESAGRAVPSLVGGPVDVAVIDKRGVRWHTVKADCASAANR